MEMTEEQLMELSLEELEKIASDNWEKYGKDYSEKLRIICIYLGEKNFNFDYKFVDDDYGLTFVYSNTGDAETIKTTNGNVLYFKMDYKEKTGIIKVGY